jgi:cyclopropane-fatty-acyl-phospholipid synthase
MMPMRRARVMSIPRSVWTSPASFAIGQILRKLIRPAQCGALTITLPSGDQIEQCGIRPGPQAVLHVVKWRMLLRLLVGGSIGLGRAYAEGECSSPDIREVLAFALRNEEQLSGGQRTGGVTRLINRMRHWRRANTRRGSRRNIAAHYDLGNAFYALWLDEGMNYSSALFASEKQTLEAAQNDKLTRIIELLDVRPNQRVLEIGCGWGPLAERLCGDGVGELTGITLSSAQLAFARARLSNLQASGDVDLRLQDYRDINERYDRVVSIEMIEAVGERYWATYFDKLRNSLSDKGIAVIQAITIDEVRFDRYRRKPDFIQTYIFPGGMLPTKRIIETQARRAGLRVIAHEAFGASYAQTLAEWRRRFLAALPQVAKLGFDQRFIRLWDYYLSYCEVGFQAETIDVGLWKFQPAEADQSLRDVETSSVGALIAADV